MKKAVITILLSAMIMTQTMVGVGAAEVVNDNLITKTEEVSDTTSQSEDNHTTGTSKNNKADVQDGSTVDSETQEDDALNPDDNHGLSEEQSQDNEDALAEDTDDVLQDAEDTTDSIDDDSKSKHKKKDYDDSDEELVEEEAEEYIEEIEETEEVLETEEVEKIATIIGFHDFDENSITVDKDNKPSIDELLSMFPESIPVEIVRNGETLTKRIKVSWYCVGDDYESSNGYYFQFNPRWDSEKYQLSSEIDADSDIPYIAVNVRDNSNSSGKKSQKNVDSKLIKWSTAYDPSSQEEDKEMIFDYLVGKMGLSNAAACGVMANIQYESGFSNIALGDGGTSYGLCQWHAERFTRLRKYCGSRGIDYRTTQGQLRYLEYELRKSFPDVLDYLEHVENNKKGAYNAAYYWCINFEKPSDMNEKAVTRGNLASKALWKVYQDKFIVYRIEYELQDGVNDSFNPIAYSNLSEEIMLEPAYRSGYMFEGWYTDGDYKNEVYKLTGEMAGNIILYAKWRECTEEELLEQQNYELSAHNKLSSDSIIKPVLGIEGDYIGEDKEYAYNSDDELDVLIGNDDTASDEYGDNWLEELEDETEELVMDEIVFD